MSEEEFLEVAKEAPKQEEVKDDPKDPTYVCNFILDGTSQRNMFMRLKESELKELKEAIEKNKGGMRNKYLFSDYSFVRLSDVSALEAMTFQDFQKSLYAASLLDAQPKTVPTHIPEDTKVQ